MQQICNPFWKDGFKHYKKMYTNCLPESMHGFVSECIHYNININKRILYIKDWFDAGILYVHHLLDKDGSLLLKNLNSYFQMSDKKKYIWGCH